MYGPELEKGALPLASAKDAVVITVNSENPVVDMLMHHGITKETATKIWITIEYTTWGQVIGNGDKTPIHVYTRSDACGAAETFAMWMDKKQEDLQGTAVFGDPGLASAIQADKLGIGLNNIGYAYDTKSGKPNEGLLVAPIDVNDNGVIDPEEDFYETKKDIVDAIADGRYPSPPARDLYLVSKGIPTDPVVVAFLKYILTEGQKENSGQGYIEIPQDKLDAGLAKIGAKK